ncbi:hypothetical protein ACOCEA_05425 [Maribacter sp. CXY002]|uniref:hypothetical protein n=1 Tax=Maribacter luteocoastalis TaxID=3407671 RepID=UPI003B66EB95
MMKIVNKAISIFLFLLVECQSNVDIDCSNVLCANQSFAIELVDSTGINLLENGTYLKKKMNFLENCCNQGVSHQVLNGFLLNWEL